MAEDSKIRELLDRYAEGDLTPVQLNFWMKSLNIKQEQLNRVYKQIDKDTLVGSVTLLVICFAVGSIFLYLIGF